MLDQMQQPSDDERIATTHVALTLNAQLRRIGRHGPIPGRVATENRRIEMASTTDPTAAVCQYTDALSKGDAKVMAAICTDSVRLLDGRSAHMWRWPTGAKDEYRDEPADDESTAASDYSFTLGEPRYVAVCGRNAYVILRATMSFSVHGQRVTQNGSVYTMLRRVGTDWRLRAWDWEKETR